RLHDFFSNRDFFLNYYFTFAGAILSSATVITRNNRTKRYAKKQTTRTEEKMQESARSFSFLLQFSPLEFWFFN
ncbi:hypothetical protein M5D96_010811, partial [Drosophila gunungcola]